MIALGSPSRAWRWLAPAACVVGLALGGIPALSAAASKDRGTTGVRWFDGTFDAALKAAAAQKKLLLFDAWATWCKYCKELDRMVWNREEVGRAVEREAIAVKVEVDILKGVGLALRERYEIGPLPLILVIDPENGEALERLEGTQSPETILAAIDRARLRARATEIVAEAGEDTAELVRTAWQLRRAGDAEQARESAERALKLDATCANDDADDAALLLADMAERDGAAAMGLRSLRQALEHCKAASSQQELWQRVIALSASVEGEDARGKALGWRAERERENGDAQRALGEWILAFKKDAGAARSYAERALELNPDDALALGLMAQVELSAGNGARALTLIERAIAQDPHDPKLREIRLRAVLATRAATGS